MRSKKTPAGCWAPRGVAGIVQLVPGEQSRPKRITHRLIPSSQGDSVAVSLSQTDGIEGLALTRLALDIRGLYYTGHSFTVRIFSRDGVSVVTITKRNKRFESRRFFILLASYPQ